MLTLNAEFFESLVGKKLAYNNPNAVEIWQVTRVTRRELHQLRQDQPFNVYLAAPAGNDRAQGVKRLVLPDDQTVELFAVPIGATADAVSYEVIFN